MTDTKREALEEKKEEAQILLDEMEQKIGEALQSYQALEDLGYSDHYIKQELDFNFMDSLPAKIQALREEVEQDGDDEE